jgi:hypothetical protein
MVGLLEKLLDMNSFCFGVCRVKKVGETNYDFTDYAYQSRLPLHARSTASKSIKNNLALTEIMADKSAIHNAQKVSTTHLHASQKWKHV